MSTTALPREAKTPGTQVRTFSVRVPETLYGEAQRVAESRKVSINALVGQALSKVIDEAHDQEMYDAATLLGRDAEMCNVDFAFNAQSEVILASE